MNITVIELKSRLDAGESPLVIDVREPYEFEEYNIGAELISLGDLPNKLDDLEEYKEQEIILHCRSGARSTGAQQFLIKNGFSNVRNLEGGILEWQRQFG
ncbi:rhodanese-like domain-containing protein [Bacteroidia bacterium]|nr:rhodanese-like domain-containing protein [Bacteroidia bacterium]